MSRFFLPILPIHGKFNLGKMVKNTHTNHARAENGHGGFARIMANISGRNGSFPQIHDLCLKIL